MKVFKIEDAVEFYSDLKGIRVFNTSERIQTRNNYYSGGEDKERPRTGAIVGRFVNDYKVSEELMEQGYTTHEVYKVEYDDGKVSVLWPDEVLSIDDTDLQETRK